MVVLLTIKLLAWLDINYLYMWGKIKLNVLYSKRETNSDPSTRSLETKTKSKNILWLNTSCSGISVQ